MDSGLHKKALSHYSVLLQELVGLVFWKVDGIYIDCTGGFGGHSSLMLSKLSEKGKLVILDCDPQAVALLQSKFSDDKRVSVYCEPFSNLGKILKDEGVLLVDGLMADLGFSSLQLDDPERGISFLGEGPLDMRLSHKYEETALDLMERASVLELEELIREYGEEKHATLLARKIKESQENIKTTKDLRELAERVIGRFYRGQKIHPATRLFQALRIAVNQELSQLDALLDLIPAVLNSEGRAGIISFHSLEDRKVKHRFRSMGTQGFVVLTKRPILPSEEEVELNSRSRSAKLRGIQKK